MIYDVLGEKSKLVIMKELRRTKLIKISCRFFPRIPIRSTPLMSHIWMQPRGGKFAEKRHVRGNSIQNVRIHRCGTKEI